MSDQELDLLPGAAGDCVTSIVATAAVGGLFGGVGALLGAAAAATGPNCLGWW
ncbi:MAG: hypothetical protein V4721_02615 [Bacteroidota bacterium]